MPAQCDAVGGCDGGGGPGGSATVVPSGERERRGRGGSNHPSIGRSFSDAARPDLNLAPASRLRFALKLLSLPQRGFEGGGNTRSSTL